MRRRTLLRVAAAGVPSLLAGCGGDGGGDGGGETPPTPSPTQAGTPAGAQQQFPDYEWSKLEDASPVATSTITISGFAFTPLIAAVEPGTEVTVTNEDSTSHTFTAPRLGINKSVSGGGGISFTVEQTGTFDYVCTVHPTGMLGRLVVTNTPPTETPTETQTSTLSGQGVKSTDTNTFDPIRLEVATGTTVTWQNTARGMYSTHTVTAAQFHDVAASWEMDVTLGSGETASHTFGEAGVYEYNCKIHGKHTMCGVVLVGDATLNASLPCEE